MGFVLFLALAVPVLYLIYRAETRKNAMNDATLIDIGGERCVLCQSSELREVEAETLLCSACGNVQGALVAEYHLLQRRKKYAAMDPGERVNRARTLLSEAALEFIALEGELPNVLELAKKDRRSRSSDEGELRSDTLSRFIEVTGELASLEHKLADVAVVLAEPVEIEPFLEDVATMRSYFKELSLWPVGLGGAFAEGNLEREIRVAMTHLEELESHLEGLKDRIQG